MVSSPEMNPIVSAIALVLLLSTSLFAQRGSTGSTSGGAANANNQPATGQYEIRGKLEFPDSKIPLERIEVQLELRLQRFQTVFADSFGNYEFRNLPAGDYVVAIHLPDYEDVIQNVTILSGMQMTTTLNIPMNPLFTIVRK